MNRNGSERTVIVSTVIVTKVIVSKVIVSTAVATVALIACAGTGCAPVRGVESSGRATRLGIVDTEEVFNRYRKSVDRKQEIDVQASVVFDRAGALKSSRTELRNEQSKHAPGSPEFETAQAALDELEVKVGPLEEELRRLSGLFDDVIAEINLEIQQAVSRIGSDRNLEAVFEKRMVLKGIGPRRIARPLVHYAQPHLEITEDTIERLNREYLRTKTSGGALDDAPRREPAPAPAPAE